jgi:hypothetical protein
VRVVAIIGAPHDVGRSDHRQLPDPVQCCIDVGEVLIHVHRDRAVASSCEHCDVPLTVHAEPVELDSPSRVRPGHLHGKDPIAAACEPTASASAGVRLLLQGRSGGQVRLARVR